VRSAERQLSLLVLDRHWSDHLALIDDIREGIHLQRYGGREPLQEFHKQLAAAFDAMRAAIDGEVARRFRLLTVADGRIDLSRAGIQGPASTWTYLINDDPFSSFGVSLIAGRNLGVSAAVGMIAVLYWPITLAIAARVLLRRWTARRP
jgi:preprotein translocase subunit SecA